MNLWVPRVAGIAGVLCVVAMIPAYVVGTPDRPHDAADVARYFADSAAFVVANGTVPVLHVFFFLFFLGGLIGWLRTDGNPVAAVGGRTVLAGGITFAALSAAGFAAEVLGPATAVRFAAVGSAPEIALAGLTLAVWLYHYCQVGAAVMIAATAVIGARTRLLPSWAVVVSGICALGTLLHVFFGAWSAYLGLAWILLVSAFMIAAPDRTRRVVVTS